MTVVPDRDSFEAALIDCSETGDAVDGLPPPRVRGRHPVHEARQGAVHVWGYDEMPMVRHDAVRKNCHVDTRDGFVEQVLEREIVAGIMEKNRAFGRSIQYVEYQSGGVFPLSSRHSGMTEAIPVPGCSLASVLNK